MTESGTPLKKRSEIVADIRLSFWDSLSQVLGMKDKEAALKLLASSFVGILDRCEQRLQKEGE